MGEERRRRTMRQQLRLRHERFDDVSPEVGSLDASVVEEFLDRDPDAAVSLVADLSTALDEGLRRLATQLARRLVLDLAAPVARGRGGGAAARLRTDRMPEVGGDLDLDASLDAVVEARARRRPPAPEELRAHVWARPSTAVCLLVDRSGSMRGDRLATAAVCAAAVALRAPVDHSVLAFAEEVLVLRSQGSARSTAAVVDDLLVLRGHGSTDLGAALGAAADQLHRSSARRKLVLLLSDCRPTEGSDPLVRARDIDELLVVAPDGDDDDARALVDAVGGRLATASGPSTVAAAVAALLDR